VTLNKNPIFFGSSSGNALAMDVGKGKEKDFNI
jgi:hypothetical protein